MDGIPPYHRPDLSQLNRGEALAASAYLGSQRCCSISFFIAKRLLKTNPQNKYVAGAMHVH